MFLDIFLKILKRVVRWYADDSPDYSYMINEMKHALEQEGHHLDWVMDWTDYSSKWQRSFEKEKYNFNCIFRDLKLKKEKQHGSKP